MTEKQFYLPDMDPDFLQGSSEPIHGGMDMSLVLNDKWPQARTYENDDFIEDQRDLDRLGRYLAIMETNKKSCNFVPNDALMALDMAGFVRDCLNGQSIGTQISAARMALSLVQGKANIPVQ